MTRREYSYGPQCAEAGCKARANYVFTSQREMREHMESERRRGGWRCVRHTNSETVLSAENRAREHVLEVYETDFGRGGQAHQFWAPVGQQKGGSGFVYGPGFKAFAKDFPAGTRLVVTARITEAA